MNTYEIPVSSLKALLHIAPKIDVRYYLVGVLLEPTTGRMVATDGSCMLVVRHDSLMTGGASVILPRDLVERAVKLVKRPLTTVTLDVDGESLTFRAAGTSIYGAAIDGRYPDYPRVVPSEVSGLAGMFDPSIVARVGDALQALHGSKNQQGVRMFQNGQDKAALMMLDYTLAESVPAHVAVVMPLRNDMTVNHAGAAVAAAMSSAG